MVGGVELNPAFWNGRCWDLFRSRSPLGQDPTYLTFEFPVLTTGEGHTVKLRTARALARAAEDVLSPRKIIETIKSQGLSRWTMD